MDVAIQLLDQRITSMDTNITTALGIANQTMEKFQATDNELRARLETIVADVNDRIAKIQVQINNAFGIHLQRQPPPKLHAVSEQTLARLRCAFGGELQHDGA